MDKSGRSVQQPADDQWELEQALRQDLGISALGEDQELTEGDGFENLLTGTAEDLAAAATAPSDAEGDDDEEELLLEDVISLPEDQPREETSSPSQLARPADPGAITTLEADLAAAGDRQQIAAVAVRIAACYARAAALFVVNNDTIAGLYAEGEGLAERIEGVLISTETAGLFRAPLKTGRAYRLRPSDAPNDVRLMRALGRSDACDVLVVPVALRGRTVNLIYADNGPDRLADTAAGALVTLGSCLVKAYERLISA